MTDFGLRTNGARRSAVLSSGDLESRVCMTATLAPTPEPAPTAAAPTLQDIINEARKNDEVKRLMDGGRFGVGVKPTIRASRPEEAGVIGGSRAVYVREGNRIVINLNAISSASDGAGSLLFELLRFKHRDEHKALDDKAFKGEIDKNAFVIANEKLSYELSKEHHKIASGFQGPGKWTPATDHLSDVSKYNTFEDYFRGMRNHPNRDNRQAFEDHLRTFGEAYNRLRGEGRSSGVRPDYDGRKDQPEESPGDLPEVEDGDGVGPDDDLSDEGAPEDWDGSSSDLYSLNDDLYIYDPDGWWGDSNRWRPVEVEEEASATAV